MYIVMCEVPETGRTDKCDLILKAEAKTTSIPYLHSDVFHFPSQRGRVRAQWEDICPHHRTFLTLLALSHM